MSMFHHLILFMLIFSAVAQGVGHDDEDLLSEVPSQHRAQLAKRLRTYLKYERQKDYEKLYDMLSEQTKHPGYLKRNGGQTPLQTKDSYVKYRVASYPRFPSFTPASVRRLDAFTYEIRGQAKVLYKGGILKDERVLYAQLENGTWLFSEFNTLLEH